MKQFKFILSFLMLFAFSCSFGQTATTMTASASSITAPGIGYHTKQLSQASDVVTIQVNVSKTSGTVAGYALPQASLDGTNYVNISTDSLSLANQSMNTKIWTFDKRKYIYYRVKVETTGTSVVAPVAYVFTQGFPRTASTY